MIDSDALRPPIDVSELQRLKVEDLCLGMKLTRDSKTWCCSFFSSLGTC